MIVKDKKFYKMILVIAVPIAVQNLIGFMVNLVDTLMLGRLGENSLSGANLAGQMFFIMHVVIAGIAEGSNVLSSQYYGKKDIKSIHKIYAIAYRCAIIAGLIATFIAFFFPEQFLRIYSNEPEVVAEGAKYLKIMALGYLPYAFTAVNVTMLRAVHSTKISIVVYGASFVTNASLNYILIFGNFGCPKLGIQGAAIATVIARCLELVIILVYLAKYEKKIHLRIPHLISVDKIMFKRFISNSSVILVNELVWVLGSTSIAVIFGRLGKEVVAANAISSVMFQFVSIFLFGVASAALVTIGNVIGEGKIDKAYEYSKTYILIGLGIGLFAMATIFLTKDLIISFYNISDATILIAREILNANALILFFQTMSIVCGMGILRGGGDSKFILYMEMGLVWGVAVPFGFLAAFYFKLPIFWVFFITHIDEVFKTILFGYRILASNWARDVTIDYKEEKIDGNI